MVCANREEAPFAVSAGARRKKPSSTPKRSVLARFRGVVPETRFSQVYGAQRGALTEEIGLSGAAEITCSTA